MNFFRLRSSLATQNAECKPSNISKTLAFGCWKSEWGELPILLQGELPMLLLRAHTFFRFLGNRNSWLLLLTGTKLFRFITFSSKFLSSREIWTSDVFGFITWSICRLSPLRVGDRPGKALGPLYLTRLIRRWSHVTSSRTWLSIFCLSAW